MVKKISFLMLTLSLVIGVLSEGICIPPDDEGCKKKIAPKPPKGRNYFLTFEPNGAPILYWRDK